MPTFITSTLVLGCANGFVLAPSSDLNSGETIDGLRTLSDPDDMAQPNDRGKASVARVASVAKGTTTLRMGSSPRRATQLRRKRPRKQGRKHDSTMPDRMARSSA